MSLRLEDLSVGYRTKRGLVPVVDQVSLQAETGQTLGIVGESGSGKTTLARALARHLAPNGEITGGGITVEGVDVRALSEGELRRWRRRGLAFVHQDAGATLDPTMRVGAQLREVLAGHGLARDERAEKALDLLRQVQLPAAVAARYPFQLSGGQQQRVVIAAALAARPRLLVLDEPTTGLDASVEAEILGLLTRVQRELTATTVLISHDLGLVGRLCDEVAVLYAGRVVERGAAAQVLNAPAHPYTAALLGAAPKLGVPRSVRRLTAIGGRTPEPGTAAGCRFAARCPFADALCTSQEPQERLVGRQVVRCHHSEALGPDLITLSAAAPSARPARLKAVLPAAERLKVTALSRQYGRQVAVDDVSFEIRPAEVFGLVGESGSGKTTLSRAIAGLPSGTGSGSLALNGGQLSERLARRTDRRQIQMVFQSPDATLNPAQRVRTVLARALKTLGGTSTVEQLADENQIDPALLDARTTALSGGQKQRIAIARAFAGAPELVICDEPVSALDVSVQAGVLELLAERRERTGTSYLFISHDLAVVSYLADRVGVLYAGQLVEVGPAADVLDGPHHPYTDALVAAARHQPATAAPPPAAPDPTAATETTATVTTGTVTTGTATTGTTGTAAVGPATAGAVAAGPVASGGAVRGCRFAARCPHHLGRRCDEEIPQLRQIAGGHTVRCHLQLQALPTTASEENG
jgi:peptide/nickel transport system ATP-binding protein